MKKRSIIINRIGATLILALGASVALNSMHAKDAVALAKTPINAVTFRKVAPVAADDPSAFKIFGELHNHIDKSSFKTLNKSLNDPNFTSDPRTNRSQPQREDDEASQFIDWLKRVLQTALF
jgi:hypothetical protein